MEHSRRPAPDRPAGSPGGPSGAGPAWPTRPTGEADQHRRPPQTHRPAPPPNRPDQRVRDWWEPEVPAEVPPANPAPVHPADQPEVRGFPSGEPVRPAWQDEGTRLMERYDDGWLDQRDDPHARDPDDRAEAAGEGDQGGEPPRGRRGRRSGSSGRPRRRIPFWVELPILVVVALMLTFVIQTFVARVYVIPSGSMEQTLNGNNGTGDRILVDKVVYDFYSPRPGDVVVFKGPDGWDQTEFYVSSTGNPVLHWLHQLASSIGLAKPDEYDLVKRVVAVGGQTVQCCDAQNRVMVDGKPLDEPYVYWQPGRGGPQNQLRFGPVTVPRGYLWVMGDNRNNSADSRYQNGGGIHGVVPVANVIGKARTIIWPPSRWRGIGDHNPQTLALASAPRWAGYLPSGVGALGAFPTVWLGRRGFGAFRRLRRSRRGRSPER